METTTKILLVDDDDDLRDIVRTEVMVSSGHRIVEAPDCDTAIRLLQGESFDLVLLDITLPDKSGLEVLKFIKEKRLSTKVIMVTGTAGLENAITSTTLGAQDYITKPFTINYLLRSIEHALSIEHTREGLPGTR
ncbi:MAG: putative Fis family transcriptional regulator [Bacteroidetes bacterium]|nr:putative Fis family transcriptional regulator [Bacteroidota bacterium]